MEIQNKDYRIAVIGLGYVGLPLAVEFAKKFEVIGFDISQKRITELTKSYDRTEEIAQSDLELVQGSIKYTNSEKDIAEANFYILALPTPVNKFNVPDFDALVAASKTTGKYLRKGDIVVYESTVYPGATREVCVPVLEQASGLVFNKDFFVGYSPERISPADKSRVAEIVKVTSGSNEESAQIIDAIYSTIIDQTFLVSSMEVAEACKVVENAQRDVNIGFMNEVTVLLNKLNIDTKEVIEAMKTKWNSLGFVPGLVGGHCIGIDPYYLVHKAQSVGHNMGIVKATRNINDSMGFFVASEIVLLSSQKILRYRERGLLLMGASFKENCPDVRNAKPLDIKKELEKYSIVVDVYDPVVKPEEMKEFFNITVLDKPENGKYDIIIIAVMHDEFKKLDFAQIRTFGKESCVIYDIKSIFPKDKTDGRL